ncbi:MAG: hypothetical protein ACK5LG_21960 [Bacteroides thetaiotaomicron]
MVSWKMIKTFGPWIILILGLAASVYLIYDRGFESGKQEVQDAWDTEKASYKKAMDTLRDQYATLESKVRQDNQRNSDELAEKDKAHAVALERIERDYAGRLQLSEQRARRYQRQAQGGASEQADLARHAAELDRSLEEGRRVVAELSATLRQRDEQLRALAQQLINDRKLLTLDESK